MKNIKGEMSYRIDIETLLNFILANNPSAIYWFQCDFFGKFGVHNYFTGINFT